MMIRTQQTRLAGNDRFLIGFSQSVPGGSILAMNREGSHPEQLIDAGDSGGVGAWPKSRNSLLVAARSSDGAVKNSALLRFFEHYRPSVYAYFLGAAGVVGEAEELTQGFIATKIVEGDLLCKYKPGLGSLRGYLIASMKNYLTDEARRRVQRRHLEARSSRAGRPGEAGRNREEEAAAAHLREYYRGVLNEALEVFREVLIEGGEAAYWDLFAMQLPSPGDRSEGLTKAQAGAQLGLSNPHSDLYRLRARFALCVRRILAERLGPGEGVEEEVAAMNAALSAPTSGR